MKPAPLLGPLETEVMDVMWRMREATVREVLDALQQRRAIAYTSVMTVMNNLVGKALLRRSLEGKAYVYTVALSREGFLERASREAVSDILERFGDLAVARFVETLAKLGPEDLERLRRLAGREEPTRRGPQP